MRILSRIRTSLLPHISRIFSASLDSGTVRFSVFLFCLAVAAMNIWMDMSVPLNLLTARIDVLSHPFSAVHHIQFGEMLYRIGNTKEAERELAIAGQFSSVLGAQSPSAVMQQTWDTESNRLNKLYMFWLHIIEVKPDYRDAYLTLASLAHALHKENEVQGYLHQAYTLDPNLKP